MSEDVLAMEEMAMELGRPDLVWRPEQDQEPVVLSAQGPGTVAPQPPDPMSKYPSILTLSDWIEDEPLPEELVEGVLHREMKLMLGGGSKSFKTWVLMQLAMGVGSGGNWMGFPCRQGNVLMVNYELHPAFCQRRMRRVCQRLGCDFQQLPNVGVWNLRGRATSAKEFVDDVSETLSRRNYSLIILDPVYKMLGDNVENAAEDVAEVLNALDRLAVQTGAAIAFGHHFSKGNQAGKESIDRVSGSGVWARDPDSLITLTRHEQDNSYTVDLTLRNHSPVDPFVVQWDYPVMVRREDLNAYRLRRPGRGRQFTPQQVLDVLQANEGAMKASDWQRACQQQLGMASSTFYNNLRALQSDTLVIDGANGYLPVIPLGEAMGASSSPETPRTPN